KVKVVRDKEEKEIDLTVGQQAAVPGSGSLGLQAEDVGDDKGVRVTEVTQNGPAARAGLQIGDVIHRVGNRPVRDFQGLLEITRALRAGEQVTIELARDAETKVVDVTLGRRIGGPGGGGFGGPGGPTAKRPYIAYYGGQRENVQDQQGPDSYQYG